MNGLSKGWINHERRKEVKNREEEEKEGGKAGMKKTRGIRYENIKTATNQ